MNQPPPPHRKGSTSPFRKTLGVVKNRAGSVFNCTRVTAAGPGKHAQVNTRGPPGRSERGQSSGAEGSGPDGSDLGGAASRCRGWQLGVPEPRAAGCSAWVRPGPGHGLGTWHFPRTHLQSFGRPPPPEPWALLAVPALPPAPPPAAEMRPQIMKWKLPGT